MSRKNKDLINEFETVRSQVDDIIKNLEKRKEVVDLSLHSRKLLHELLGDFMDSMNMILEETYCEVCGEESDFPICISCKKMGGKHGKRK